MRLGRAGLFAILFIAVTSGLRYRFTSEVHAEDRTTLSFSRQQTSTAPTIKVYSRETIVDVTVTDKDGRPVHGLGKGDFIVKEDGKPQPIRSFEEFGSATTWSPAPPKLPPHVYTNLQPPMPDGPINIILLDAVSTAPDLPPTGVIFKSEISGPLTVGQAFWMQHNMKEEAKKYLRSMPAGARATVLGLSPGGLRVLQGPTTDSELLTAAVDSLEPVIDTLPKVPMTLEALGQVAAAAAQIKGRKNLIWFAYGYDLTGLGGVIPGCPGGYPEVWVHQVFSALAAAQVTVYPIGSGGVYAAFHARACDDLSLEAIAEEGGGEAFYNSNDLAGLAAKAVAAGSDYYTLSYTTPGSDYDGRHHGIHVEVDKPGIKLTYRYEYYAEDPRAITPKAGLTLAAASSSDPARPVDMRREMTRSLPTSQGVLFDVQVEPSAEAARAGDPAVFGVLNVKLKAKPLARYGFTYAFPGSEIALKPAADGKLHGSLEFDLAAYYGDGNVVTSLRQAIDLNLTAEQARQLAGSPFRYFQQLDLPAGALFVRVGVLDRSADKVGTLEIPLTVAKPVHTAAAPETDDRPK